MKPPPTYLELIEKDWKNNLPGLQKCLSLAYAAARKKTDAKIDADFASPNRAVLEGQVRWGMVDVFLERGCVNGLVKGVSPHWIATGGRGGGKALELRAKNSAVIAFHLPFPEEPPRDSKVRTDMRVMNQLNQMLPSLGIEESLEENGEDEQPSLFGWKENRDNRLINLTLVHGNKLGEFAFLRVYNRKDDLSSFIPIFGNIMALPGIVIPAESEPIADAQIGLKGNLQRKKKQDPGGGNA